MLEGVAPGRPIALYAHDHHARWVSRTALRLAQVDGPRGAAAGGLVRRDERGVPTGMLHESAASLVDAAIPDPGPEQLEEGLRVVAAKLATLGLTGVHDPGELNDDRVMKRGPVFYRELAAAGRLPLRVHGSIRAPQLDRAIELRLRSGERTGRYTTGWLKLFADGSLGSRSAALLEPYEDAATNPPTGGPSGMVVTDAEELADLLGTAARAGIVGQVHAIGDAAVRMALDALTPVDVPDSLLRRRIEHAQLVDPADQGRFGALGIAASVQPVHLRSDAPQERLAWGERAENSFPLRTFDETGALMPFGTDAPVEPADPWPGIAVAVVRRDPSDAGATPMGREQSISLSRAIRAACLDPARVAGRDDLGRLVPGCAADFVIVPAAPFREGADPSSVASLRPRATFIDGERL
jgi:predicted amidohydrolase YtcJ